MKIGAIDLFCGIGGLSYGFRQQKIEILGGYDVDETCKYAFEENLKAKFIAKDIRDVSASDLNRLFKASGADYRVLIGCAPCQPFSMYSGRYRRMGAVDQRWELLKEFLRVALKVKPDVITMENVPRLRLHPIFDRFVSALRKGGYSVTFETLRAQQFGVPQKRARLVLFASRHGGIPMPKPTHKGREPTVRDAIGDLPPIRAGETHPTDRLHGGRGLSKRNFNRIKHTKAGGSWKDWDYSMQLACHRKKSGKSFRSVYGRMLWDEPSPVITTQCLGIGNGRFGHPVQNRAITVREAALLQSFPKGFKFVPPKDTVVQLHLARQIGNAVPVKLGSVIAKAIRKHLEQV